MSGQPRAQALACAAALVLGVGGFPELEACAASPTTADESAALKEGTACKPAAMSFLVLFSCSTSTCDRIFEPHRVERRIPVDKNCQTASALARAISDRAHLPISALQLSFATIVMTSDTTPIVLSTQEGEGVRFSLGLTADWKDASFAVEPLDPTAPRNAVLSRKPLSGRTALLRRLTLKGRDYVFVARALALDPARSDFSKEIAERQMVFISDATALPQGDWVAFEQKTEVPRPSKPPAPIADP